MSPVTTPFSRDWEQSTAISSWAANVDRALSVGSSSRASSVISDTTLVDTSDSLCTTGDKSCDSTNSGSFFVAGTIKVKAAVSAFAKSRSRHGNCPGCKSKRLAAQEEQKKREEKIVANSAKNARPAWRY